MSDTHFLRKAAISAIIKMMALLLLAIAASCNTTGGATGADTVSGASPAGSTLTTQTEIPRLDDGKKTLVVYFSQGSATKRVAEDLALALSADIERIVETKPRKPGLAGFLSAGADSSMGKATPIASPAFDPSLYDRVVVCTPVWAWHVVPPVRTWLNLMRTGLEKSGGSPVCAFVVVSADTKPEKILNMMSKESGILPLAYASFVEKDFGETNRAAYGAKLSGLLDKLR